MIWQADLLERAKGSQQRVKETERGRESERERRERERRERESIMAICTLENQKIQWLLILSRWKPQNKKIKDATQAQIRAVGANWTAVGMSLNWKAEGTGD